MNKTVKTKWIVMTGAMALSLVLLAGCNNAAPKAASSKQETGSAVSSAAQKDEDTVSMLSSAESNAEKEAATSILNDDKTYFFSYNGETFYAGDPIQKLLDAGLTMDEKELDMTVEANTRVIGAGKMKTPEGAKAFSIFPLNDSAEAKALKDISIGGFHIDHFNVRENASSAEIEIYGGIKIGSTPEDVEAVFGEPTMVVGEEPNATYRYESDEAYRSLKIMFADNVVEDISWDNFLSNMN